jgi:hypothetical protein
MSTYTVATFYDPNEYRGKLGPKSGVKRTHIKAFISWFNAEGVDAIMYDVEAESRADAKRKAIDLRLSQELAKAGIQPLPGQERKNRKDSKISLERKDRKAL